MIALISCRANSTAAGPNGGLRTRNEADVLITDQGLLSSSLSIAATYFPGESGHFVLQEISLLSEKTTVPDAFSVTSKYM